MEEGINPYVLAAITLVGSIIGSGGFWAFISVRMNKKSAVTEIVLGLAHERIVYTGMTYIERGYITKDEYEDFVKYLCEPYSKFGGNGMAEKIMRDVGSLTIYARHRDISEDKEEGMYDGRI